VAKAVGEAQNLKNQAVVEAQNLKKQLAVLQKECDLLRGSLAECKVILTEREFFFDNRLVRILLFNY